MDKIDDLLTPGEERAPDSADRIWRATARAVARRRWLRRGRIAAVIVAVYLAGAMTMWGVHSPPGAPSPIPVAAAPPEKVAPAPAADPYENDPPGRMERWARMADGEKKRSLYRRAGDGYLSAGDELAALRCYRKALDGSPPTEWVVQTQDSWLLTSLKFAQRKE